ncbi:hypothetical protein CASFOL_013498 [Castilleja foliolosa]|uniref:Myb/SANT-like domain-containing protein n=1 Tax=Castilleja foliolosa TaxID=1961234 RepID=A0ABD3DK76_9LAMI
MANELPPNREQGEVHFLKLMAEELRKAEYPPGSTFRRESMLYVFKKFRIAYGPMYSDRYLKSKIKQLFKKYREFSVLMSEDEIYWDKQNNIVYGNDKLLREKYKARYRAGAYLGEENYDLMCEIFESGVKFE